MKNRAIIIFWILTAVVTLFSLGLFETGLVFSGAAFLLLAISINPFIINLINKKYNFKIKWWMPVILLFVSIVAIASSPSADNAELNNPLKHNTKVIETAAPTQTPEVPTIPELISNPEVTPEPIVIKGNLKVHFLNVGQADSILIELPNGQKMLIDAGNNADGSTVVNYLKKNNISAIDYLIGTHPHEDHIGGLDTVINSFDVGKIYMPKKSNTTKTFEDVLTAIKNKGLSVQTAKSGVNILNADELTINILAPVSDNYEDLNDYSAVIKLTYKNNSFIFMGDAETVVQNQILNKDIKADVIKIGHHGSSSSTSSSFINKVSPQHAIISVGSGNEYGHPTTRTLSILNNAGINVYRTDEQGTIVATSDGTNIVIDKKASSIKQQAPPEVSENTKRDNIGSYPDSKPTSEQYIGNKSSKKFHRPTCSTLPADYNRVYFDMRNEAVNSGYIPCKKCNP